jgi:hypothetical protein
VVIPVVIHVVIPLIFLEKGGSMNGDWFERTVLSELLKNIPLRIFAEKDLIFAMG